MEGWGHLIGHPALTLFLSTFAPTLAFIALNQEFFTYRQNRNALLVAGITGLIISAIGAWLHAAGSLPTTEENIAVFSVPDFLLCLCALSLFIILSQRFFEEVIPDKNKRIPVLVFLLAALPILSGLFSLAIPNIILLIYVTTSLLDAKKNSIREKKIQFTDEADDRFSKSTDTGVSLAIKPNIYLLILESWSSSAALKKLFDINDQVTDELFNKFGFTNYENIYSNYPSTTRSCTAMFSCTLFKTDRNNFVFQTLRNNDYEMNFFDSYVFASMVREKDYATFILSPLAEKLYRLMGPILSQSRYIRDRVTDMDPFETKILSVEETISYLKTRLTRQTHRPQFYGLRFGPSHKQNEPWTENTSVFKQTYRDRLEKAQVSLEKIISLIVEHDPNALIVAIGDHGSQLHQNVWVGQGDINDIVRERISIEDLAFSHFSVRCAIKWPVKHDTANTIFSHVNLFKYIFRALGAKEDILDSLAPNVSILPVPYVVVKDGVIQTRLERYSSTETLTRYKAGKATLEDFLSLVKTVENPADRVPLLEEAITFYPNDMELLQGLGEEYCRRGLVSGLAYLERALPRIKQDAAYSLSYITHLTNLGKYEEALSFFYVQKTFIARNIGYYHSTYWRILFNLGRTDGLPQYIQEMGRLHPLFFGKLLSILIAEKKLAEAEKLAIFIKNKNPKHYGDPHSLWHLNKIILAVRLLEKDFKAAESMLLDRCLSIKSPEAMDWLILSHVQEKQGKIDEAISNLQKGSELQPGLSKTLCTRIGYMASYHTILDPEFSKARAAAAENLKTITGIFEQYNAFNKQYYIEHELQGKAVQDPVHHYLYEGCYMNLNPAPWFDSFFYALLHQDIWQSGIHPFVHFIQSGLTGLREASPSVSAAVALVEDPSTIHHPELMLAAFDRFWAGRAQ